MVWLFRIESSWREAPRNYNFTSTQKTRTPILYRKTAILLRYVMHIFFIKSH